MSRNMGFAMIVLLLSLLLWKETQGLVVCKENEKRVQKKGIDIESNGCSKPAFLDVPGEEDFTYCCDRHDACYATCGMGKSYCDNDFGKCMEGMCKTHFNKNKMCISAAETYTMGTRVFGQEGYEDLQRRHCICVDKENVRAHYREVVDDYFEKHVPEKKRNRTESYMEKSKYTDTKPHKLFYQIVKKFPDVITHIDGRVGRTSVPGYHEEL